MTTAANLISMNIPKIDICYVDPSKSARDINNALLNYKNVVMRPGKYYINEPIEGYSSQTLEGSGNNCILKAVDNIPAVVTTKVGAIGFTYKDFVVDADNKATIGVEYKDFSTSQSSEVSGGLTIFDNLLVVNCLGDCFYMGDSSKISMAHCSGRSSGGYGLYHIGTDSRITDCSFYLLGKAGIVSGENDRFLSVKMFHTNQDQTISDNIYGMIISHSNFLNGVYIEELPYSGLKINGNANRCDVMFTNVGTGYNFDTATREYKENWLVSFRNDSCNNRITANWRMTMLDNQPDIVQHIINLEGLNVFQNEINIKRYKRNKTLILADPIKQKGFLHFSNKFVIDDVDVDKNYTVDNVDLSNFITTAISGITLSSKASTNLYTIDVSEGLQNVTTVSGIIISRDLLLEYPTVQQDILDGIVNNIHIEYDAYHGIPDGTAWMGINIQLTDNINSHEVYNSSSSYYNRSNTTDKVDFTNSNVMSNMRDYYSTLIANGGQYALNLRLTFRAYTDNGIPDTKARLKFTNLKVAFSKDVVVKNLLASTGNFAVDTDADGVADGWVSTNAGTKSVISNVQYFHPSAQWGNIKADISSHIVEGHKYFVCAYVKSADNPDAGYVFETNTGTTTNMQSIGTSPDFVFISAILTATTEPTTNARISFVNTTVAGIGKEIAVKDVFLVDLTNDFGDGNDPIFFDTWMKNKIDTDGYFLSTAYED